MWQAKLKIRHSDCPIVRRAEKFKTIVLSYPLGWHEQGKDKLSSTLCFFESPEAETKKRFLADLKRDPRITNLEITGSTFIYEIKLKEGGQHVMLYYEQKLFFPKPVVNSPDGHEYWEVASWKKEDILGFVKELKKHMDVCELISITQTKLSEVYFPNVMPQLSEGQKNALKTAYMNGYYTFPRDTDIETLAKISKKSTSTFQEHLRKAENKIMPNFVANYLRERKRR